jgi:integrase
LDFLTHRRGGADVLVQANSHRETSRDRTENLTARAPRLEGCRHPHASLPVAAGTPIADVADRLGHAGASVTMLVYAHMTADQRGAAAHVISAALEGFEAKAWQSVCKSSGLHL